MNLLTPEYREEAKHLVKEALQETLTGMRLNKHVAIEGEQVLNVPEVAQLLHCTQDTVRDFAQAGKIKCFKPSKSYLFLKSDVIEWIKAHPKQTTARNNA